MRIPALLLVSLLSIALPAIADESLDDFSQTLGSFLEQQAVENQAEQIVLSLFYREAEEGDPYAQYNLGLSYATGRGVPEDPNQAAHWYQKSESRHRDSWHRSWPRSLSVLPATLKLIIPYRLITSPLNRFVVFS